MAKQIKCTFCDADAEHGVHYISGRNVCSVWCCENDFQKLRRNSDDFFRDELHRMREKDSTNEVGEMQRVQES